VVEATLGEKLQLPAAFESLKSKKKESVLVSNSFEDVKALM
jgi:hypothetical protein